MYECVVYESGQAFEHARGTYHVCVYVCMYESCVCMYECVVYESGQAFEHVRGTHHVCVCMYVCTNHVCVCMNV